MSRRKRQTAAALAGAVVLASGAYAIGSTSGDGSATAAKKSGSSASSSARHDGRRGPHGPDLAALAKALGVETADLRSALEDIRASHKPPSGDPRDGFIKDFAAAIGLPEDKVKAAFESVGPPKGARGRGKRFRHGPMGAPPPGGPMGGPPPPGGPHGPAGPPPPDGRRGRHVGPPADVVSKLAKALGVDESKVKDAFAELRTKHEAEEKTRHDEFASELANKLGIDVQKVKDALDAFRPDHGRRDEQ